jgi:ABC-type Fe3+-citrate transport system substrate-binding protein
MSQEMREKEREMHAKQIEKHQKSLVEAKSKVQTNLQSCLNKEKTTINKFKPLTEVQL